MTGSGPWRPPERTDGPSDRGDGQNERADGRPESPAGPVPDDVHSAWGLWLAATAFALVGMLLNAATTRFGDLPPATRDAFRDAVETAGSADISIEALFGVARGLGAVLAMVAAAVTVWLAFRLRAGKGWARTMLDIVAVFLVVDAVSVVISVFGGVAVAGERGEIVTFLVISLQILAGLCAATAVWRQHTAEAMKFTTGGGTRAGE
ncbi:hypothetical protein CEY15_04505 [Dietzia natronolimnaea]|uniref:Uncharacterized protein n=1 Tax=Dietzia natronolimnaea TaxID=161920 RepID=A0A2A2WSX4_9ACTN|nr:hypothetical protein [Dietzia natronolimnaea]PAY24255.1 hypothetical protein CEY15_04505 [Dietzia natronolimnaea]